MFPSGNKLINARMETLSEKPAYRAALRSRRCLIPADGFYEWKKEKGGGRGGKMPMRIRMKSQEPFAFAGLWEKWRGADGAELRTCTIITGEANEVVRPIHARMPVILRPERYREWIAAGDRDAADILPLLSTYPAEAMEAFAVGNIVNNPMSDTPDCVEPVKSGQGGDPQPGLFD